MGGWREILRRLPVAGGVANRLALTRRRASFAGSGAYWESRYREGGNSGLGSYGPLAEFKATILNGFVAERGIQRVIEFGCGDGAQLSLATYPEYVGFDVSPAVIERCRARFGGDSTRRFFIYTDRYPADLPPLPPADLALSLDVLYHLVEPEVFDRHLRDLFSASRRFVAVYSSDFDRVEAEPHVRHRRFTKLVPERFPGWRLIRHDPNPYPYREEDGSGSLADFFFFEKG